jgi:hypothetical protein
MSGTCHFTSTSSIGKRLTAFTESLWEILRHDGVSTKLVQVVAMLHIKFKSQGMCNTKFTDTFNFNTGVKAWLHLIAVLIHPGHGLDYEELHR